MNRKEDTARLDGMPSAQPETHGKRTETHACDCISRQAAIDAVGKYLEKDGDVIIIADVVDAAVAIGMLPAAEPERTCEYWDSESKFCTLCRPSAQPERKRGRWILNESQRKEDVACGNYLYICSKCGKSDIHAKTQEVPFCWWCGADMRGGEHA